MLCEHYITGRWVINSLHSFPPIWYRPFILFRLDFVLNLYPKWSLFDPLQLSFSWSGPSSSQVLLPSKSKPCVQYPRRLTSFPYRLVLPDLTEHFGKRDKLVMPDLTEHFGKRDKLVLPDLTEHFGKRELKTSTAHKDTIECVQLESSAHSTD